MKAIKRDDGLYDVCTEAGFIETVMKYQLERARRIVAKDMYGINFYKKLYN